MFFPVRHIHLTTLTQPSNNKLYKKTVSDNYMTSKDSNVSSVPELTDFEVSYSLLTNEVYLSTSFTDNMDCIPNWPLQEFPDQLICISRAKAVALIEELQKAINYMDAGIDRSSGSLLQ
ncbi:hypothetical protein MJL92_22620 [Salmonella enterica subsp. enterica serovar Cerro]|nr:hypothetical protein [Salmonella enterica]MDI5545605.1 hypothetical protein [Salmonella enterica subsp. enterica serovar Cerro]